MKTIKSIGTTLKELVDALRGDYGAYSLSNGVLVVKAGRICLFWGRFAAGTEAVEVPSLPSVFPVFFAGDDFTCVRIADENIGILKVPTAADGKRFVVFGICLLNN